MPAITKPNQHFDATTYTGTGSARSVTGVGFQPDFVWIKERSSTSQHALSDSVRGVQKRLISDTTAAEDTSAQLLTAFNSDGFSVGTDGAINENTQTYIGWQWKAGGTAVTNTTGTISSQVSANPTAGFSVVTYTGNGTIGATVGHGLGVAPNMVIVKRRNQSSAARWAVQHTSLAANEVIGLNLTNAASAETAGAGSTFNAARASSTVITLGDYGDSNASSSTYVAYCFAAVAGYSAFGSYTGNGSTDGPFVYLGFRPRFLLVKAYSSGSTERWLIWDSSRDTYNIVSNDLVPNTTAAEGGAGAALDFVSNGFKIRSAASSAFNYNGYSYIYMAFAEAPFKYSSAR